MEIVLAVGLFLNGLGLALLSRKVEELLVRFHNYEYLHKNDFDPIFEIKDSIKEVKDLVKKGNKDQQEIKTRLTWSKKREKANLKKVKVSPRKRK